MPIRVNWSKIPQRLGLRLLIYLSATWIFFGKLGQRSSYERDSKLYSSSQLVQRRGKFHSKHYKVCAQRNIFWKAIRFYLISTMSNLICLGPRATLTVHDKVNLEFNYNLDATEAFCLIIYLVM